MQTKELPEVNIEKLKNRDELTNTEIACLLLGWQGGTIHQVSQETGLTVDQILNSKDIETDIIQCSRSKSLLTVDVQL